MYDKKLASKLYDRKLFKKHIFHQDNTDEDAYFWDDYDTTYGYKMNVLACLLPSQIPQVFKPKQSEKSTQTYTKITTCICNNCHHSYNEEIATNIPVKIKQNASTQTIPNAKVIIPPKHTTCLPKPPVIILKSNTKTNVSTQTLTFQSNQTTQTLTETNNVSCQTLPKLYNPIYFFQPFCTILQYLIQHHI